VDWDCQKAVWDGILSSEVLGVRGSRTILSSSKRYFFIQINTMESSLLITEPYFNLPNIQEVYDQFVFEEYEFQSYYRCTREPYRHAFSSDFRINLLSKPPQSSHMVNSSHSLTYRPRSACWSSIPVLVSRILFPS
jgi:actin-related protein 6